MKRKRPTQELYCDEFDDENADLKLDCFNNDLEVITGFSTPNEAASQTSQIFLV